MTPLDKEDRNTEQTLVAEWLKGYGYETFDVPDDIKRFRGNGLPDITLQQATFFYTSTTNETVKLKADATAKVRSAERREKEAESKVLKLKATELLASLQKPAYKAEVSFIEKEKCDRCNDKRQLDFIYPSGNPGHESCPCAKRKLKYVVNEAIGSEARITFWGGKRELTIWYKPYNSESDSLVSSVTEVYKCQPFSEMQGSNYIFYDNAKAQEYANYLTQKAEA